MVSAAIFTSYNNNECGPAKVRGGSERGKGGSRNWSEMVKWFQRENVHSDDVGTSESSSNTQRDTVAISRTHLNM